MAVAARNGMHCAKVPGKRPLHAADHRHVATFIACRSCPSTRGPWVFSSAASFTMDRVDISEESPCTL